MGSTHKKIIRTARSSKAVADVNQVQNMLRDSQKRFFKRDIRSLLNQTMEMAKTCYPKTRATELEDTEDEDATSPTLKARGESADASDDDGADGESGGGPANAEDEKALQDMSVVSGIVLPCRASTLTSRLSSALFMHTHQDVRERPHIPETS